MTTPTILTQSSLSGRWALGLLSGSALLLLLGAWLLSFILLATAAALGLRRVPIGHRAVVTQLGGRTGRVLPEGAAWLPPFLQEIVLVDVRERSFATSEDAWTRDRIHLRFNVTLQYRVSDPSALLDVSSDAGRETPAGLGALLQQELRRLVNAGAVAELLGADAGRRESELKTRLEGDLRKGALRRWGLELMDLFVSDLDVDEDAVRAALQAERTEGLKGLGAHERMRADIHRLEILRSAALELLPALCDAAGRTVSELEAFDYLHSALAALRGLDVDEIMARRAHLIAGFQRSEHRPQLSVSNAGSYEIES